MCGVVGFFGCEGSPARVPSREVLSESVESLRHRGPDAQGLWMDGSIGIGHTRLSIRDLSDHGKQPMVSNSGRYVLAYNGELYDLGDLRSRLARSGYTLRGHSDTEVLLGSLEVFGMQATLEQANGMFAFALIDRAERALTLVRDRAGEKPLYWSLQSGVVYFASELRALRKLLPSPPDIDPASVAAFLRHNYVPGPYSIYEDIRKLKPAHIAVVDSSLNVSEVCYWSYSDLVERAAGRQRNLSDAEAVKEAGDLLTKATVRRLESDAPVGAFLSGGIDSSLVTAIMQRELSTPVKTYSAGFEDPRFDEQYYAQEMARYLGTDHHSFTFTEKDALDLIPSISHVYDEPFADSSQLPTILIARVTRNDVKVVLTGDGGDEVFTGYTRYRMLQTSNSPYVRLVLPLARQLARAFGPWSRKRVEAILARVPGISNPTRVWGRLDQVGERSNFESPVALYRSMVSHWDEPQRLCGAEDEQISDFWRHARTLELEDAATLARVIDFHTYLPDDILVKVDRATMHVGLEARTPFLDRDLLEWSAALPGRFGIRDGSGKWLLKEVLQQYVPRELFDRPKMGFGVPLAEWLRGPLHEWASDLLTSESLLRCGLLSVDAIQSRWDAHLAGEDWAYPIWNVLMFQSWLEYEQHG